MAEMSFLPAADGPGALAARIAASLAARSGFDAAAKLRLMAGGRQVGWLPRGHAGILRGFGAVLGPEQPLADGSVGVALLPGCNGFDARSAMLRTLARQLADAGHVRGWRDELFAVTAALDAPAIAVVERAAARFLGLLTFASHMNGIVDGGSAGQPALWISRRSPAKAVDPGMWDNLVAGGMPHGSDPLATLVRECGEESGIPPELAQRAQAHGSIEVLRDLPEGVQWEQVYVYDLLLPPDFTPRNQDGEVSEHRRVEVAPLLAIMSAGAMTVDATLVTLDALRRRGWLGAGEPD
ncbi:NUDIX hydrolase [Cupriavidus necator]|uniref:NUDIX hydrolase n=1 Tax=Cupriavidus necator TaxID=106590 RepID=UPI002783495F|nr:NUDIX hydrolase family protein [Cupriavidus necator]MDQ0139248.1 8-oxo-dGTP pyrophosphatase MutT (NUDIX family) [Cupriavidus necator]